MKYGNIVPAVFRNRPKRFIAEVEIDGHKETVHVKNIGILFNIDSQAPNKVVKDWLETQDYDRVIPEYTYGDSRIDFYMERGEEKFLIPSTRIRLPSMSSFTRNYLNYLMNLLE
ncbi:MAG: DNA/RNA nuclease SfsA [Lachnospiraceae bacterium]|nr:DNA/RNA nuclease SfsA [Lachnospiraceae bacterium]